MASKNEADEEVKRRLQSESERGKIVNGQKPLSPCCGSQLSGNIESYLKSIAQEISKCNNPKLKGEQTKLLDLLTSYKKLCTTIARQEVEKPKEPKIVPEIYKVLYPELYKDIREEEKNRLRSRLGRKRVDRNDPRRCVNYRSPTTTVSTPPIDDTRQREKDRFIRLVSSAPSVLLNTPSGCSARPLTTGKRRRFVPQPKELNEREREKERLARIFSSDLESNPSFRKKKVPGSLPPPPVSSKATKKICVPLAAVANKPVTKRPPAEKRHAEVGMVRKTMTDVDSTPRRLLGSGDKSDERRKKLLELKNKEYQEYVSQARQAGVVRGMDKGIIAREASILEHTAAPDTTASSPRSVTSVSTQTDLQLSSDVAAPPPVGGQPVAVTPTSKTNVFTLEADITPTNFFPVQKEAFITSPRAKLIKDLHCVSPCLPGVSPMLTLPEEGASDEKMKQMMYAEALKAQIDEKRRLEEERKRKEMEEEELIERKAREQQERLKMEYEREQSLRQDWLTQRQQQEDSLRQRLVEMELEAKEFKKKERLKKTDSFSGGVDALDEGVRRMALGQAEGGGVSPRVVQELIPRALQESAPAVAAEPTSKGPPATPRQRPRQIDNNNGELIDNTNHASGENNLENGTARSPSPVLPALQTDNLLKKSYYTSPRLNYKQSDDREDLLRGDKILTQLGLFRKELELEQERLQQRLQQQQT